VTEAPVRLNTLPNLLALSRIVATPVVMAMLLLPFPGGGLLAFAIFSAASITDYFDGRIARARGLVNTLGVFLDLTADKVLQAGVLVVMVEVELLPAWLVALLLVRELVVAGVRQLAAAGRMVIPAGALGKVKTAATQVGMALLLLAFDAGTGGPLADAGLRDPLSTTGWWVMLLATALSLISGWAYLRGALPLLLGPSGSAATEDD